MNQAAELKQAGLKTTLPRLRILELLESEKNRHLSAEEIYKLVIDSDNSIGLATIYRVLTQFEAAGLVLRHNFGERSVFELADTDHHDHMVCDSCGKIIEFHDEQIESQQIKLAKKHGFVIQDHSLCLYGLCKECHSAQT
ncbi:MAG: Fur family ferric uptake transcriptional regulator [Saprospiraceae bacterium]|jgi:Fur family ferric uptake transcriptional regulator